MNRIAEKNDLLEETHAYAMLLASRAPIPQCFAKEVMYHVHGMPLDEALRIESQSLHELGDTEDLKEGTTAFRERGEARFKGR